MREDVAEFLNPIVLDTDEDLAVSAFAALALGLIFVGSCRESVAETILQTLLERTDEELSTHSASRFFSLALGLVFLGKQVSLLVSDFLLVFSPIFLYELRKE